MQQILRTTWFGKDMLLVVSIIHLKLAVRDTDFQTPHLTDLAPNLTGKVIRPSDTVSAWITHTIDSPSSAVPYLKFTFTSVELHHLMADKQPQ